MPQPPLTAEHARLLEARERSKHWKRWGPYLSERAWGTVREDYSSGGSAWEYLPHDHARSKAYTWGEDGIAGLCDNHQRLCVAICLWNGRDPILKERLFGLSGNEGNHSEDVKECYYYLDCTPTHSYMKYLYKYPQEAFPYDDLVRENGRRRRSEPEYELLDTGIFDESRYFDVFIEYAKADFDDICLRITAVNRGADSAPLYLLPTVWFRNAWSCQREARPAIRETESSIPGALSLECQHPSLGSVRVTADGAWSLALEPPGYESSGEAGRILFTDNETNTSRLHGRPNPTRYVKDGLERYLIDGDNSCVNWEQEGTKAAFLYAGQVPASAQVSVCLRLVHNRVEEEAPDQIDTIIDQRRLEADEFFASIYGACSGSEEARLVQRQALAGLLWSKQFYYYDVDRWLSESTDGGPPAKR